MGLAIDTVLAKATNPGATLTAVTFATGDSGVIRNFAPTDMAVLERVTRAGTTSGAVRITSPLLHDNVRGLQFTTGESPAVFLLPPEQGERVYSQDTLSVSLTGGTAESDIVALSIYYSNLIGTAARLHSWADIKPLYRHLKPVEVDVVNSATVGNWTDTVITTTENLLYANTDYAVLGYVCDVSSALVGVKGNETGNLRIAGPGTTATDDTSDFFVQWSLREGTPHIPVFNSANQGSIFVSTADSAASTAVKVQLILCQLTSNLPS